MGELSVEDKRKVRKPLLWVAMASMAMAFAGLTSGYIVSRKALLRENLWVEFALPSTFIWSTLVLAISSLFLIFGSRRIDQNDSPNLTRFIWSAFSLGLLFLILQYEGWKSLIDSGVYFTGKGSSTSGSWVYAITFFHFLHVIAGVIALGVSGNRAAKGHYSATQKLGFELAATFWHFLGILWLFLFLFLHFIR